MGQGSLTDAEGADVSWINIAVTLLSLKSKKKLVSLIWPKWRSLSLVDITPLSCLRVNCWLSSSLPALLPKPLRQAPYHATLCCLHLADGLSRQRTGTSPHSLSPRHPSGRGGGDRQVFFPARLFPALLLMAAPPRLLPALHHPLQKVDVTGGISQVLQVSPMGWRTEFSFFLPWHHDSQPRAVALEGAWSLLWVLQGRQPAQTHLGYGH